MSATTTRQTRKPTIAIVGTGFGGLAAAIELRRNGFDDLIIFERSDEVGGVWQANTYPGAACDVPSPYYSFSYEPNPQWPRRFSPQAAILDYLKDVATKYEVRPHIRFGTEIASAVFDDTTTRWTLRTTAGDTVEVDIVISAVGQLSRPSWPAIPGREAFRGESFHSAQWDHSVDLSGKRVVVVGTGASAVQFVPEIQSKVGKLTLVQRSAPYILPRLDTMYSALHQSIFRRLPLTQRAERATWWAVTESLLVAFLYSRPLSRAVQSVSRAHMRRQVRNPDLLRKVWPDYPVGCKRTLFSSNYLPALVQPNVEVVTDRITAITADAVVTADGTSHPADVIIYGTGFAASDFLAPMQITGSNARDLRSQWTDGAHAYLGISVPNFPNLFLMYGPNTNLGSGSVVSMHECQARYIRQAVQHIAATDSPIAVKPEAEAEFDAKTQAKMTNGVWSMCNSWYRAADGRVAANWPGTASEYRWRTAKFDPAAYERVPAVATLGVDDLDEPTVMSGR
ncbi:flavin-containing monooxygenase [[Mycobacterium] nativiensis]|uniref:NAD(P)/FAD-dependent oxidoreductase n=1 Tax=[Mycobacterium] nativiensis TaxID=2855503 RepID=A0ABU5XV36_9MYCO|nr:NAD(P)/FAD-dependent oxidoreductase [Mycolicibacter sp. MYC340]MEB3031849.1 NAD(P)/FAD-dependent oxidoreductase [Mycolicibacter sp. MYC340]